MFINETQIRKFRPREFFFDYINTLNLTFQDD